MRDNTPSDTNTWGNSPGGWEISQRTRRYSPGVVAAPLVPSTSVDTPSLQSEPVFPWEIHRVVISAMDSARRLTVGQLRLAVREYTVEQWSPVMVLRPSAGLRGSRVRLIDRRDRLLLRAGDAEVLGASQLLIALATDASLLIADASFITLAALSQLKVGRTPS